MDTREIKINLKTALKFFRSDINPINKINILKMLKTLVSIISGNTKYIEQMYAKIINPPEVNI